MNFHFFFSSTVNNFISGWIKKIFLLTVTNTLPYIGQYSTGNCITIVKNLHVLQVQLYNLIPAVQENIGFTIYMFNMNSKNQTQKLKLEVLQMVTEHI